MSDHNAIRAQIEQALRDAPKPLTRDRALEIARGVMAATDPSLIAPFSDWFAKHGDRLVERLNG